MGAKSQFPRENGFFYGQVTRRMTTQNMNTDESCSISQTGQLGPREPFGARGEGAGSMAMGLVPGAGILAWGRAHPHHLGGYKSLQPGWASASGCACTQSEGLLGLLKVPAMLLDWGGLARGARLPAELLQGRGGSRSPFACHHGLALPQPNPQRASCLLPNLWQGGDAEGESGSEKQP